MAAPCTHGFQLRSIYGKPIVVTKRISQLPLDEILKIPNLKLILVYPSIKVDVEKGITEDFRKLWERKFISKTTSSEASVPNVSADQNSAHCNEAYLPNRSSEAKLITLEMLL